MTARCQARHCGGLLRTCLRPIGKKDYYHTRTSQAPFINVIDSLLPGKISLGSKGLPLPQVLHKTPFIFLVCASLPEKQKAFKKREVAALTTVYQSTLGPLQADEQLNLSYSVSSGQTEASYLTSQRLSFHNDRRWEMTSACLVRGSCL